MNTGAVALLIGLGVLLALAGLAAFVAMVLRRNRAEQHRLAQRGRRVPPPTAGTRQLRGLEGLRGKLARGQPIWVQPSELHLGPADVEGMARSAGFAIARRLGDPNDPVLLLSRTPVRRLDQLPGRSGATLSSMARHVTSRVCLGAGLFIAVLGMGAVPAFGLPAWFNVAAVGAGLLVAIAGGLLPLRPAFSKPNRRMTLLIAEFDGKPVRTVLAHQYLTDGRVVADVAAEFGYRYASSRHGWLTGSRWNESWITFVRTQTTQPGDGHGVPKQY
ncbi:hypothetical protein ACPZ19_48340 [Amycolatopsis lurida]